LSEFISACERYHIEPKTIFGMHYAPTPYATVVNYLKAFKTEGG